MNEELVEWQIRDEENGMVMLWFTHPSLEYIKSLDLTDKNVIMFGAGLGDVWLALRCKKLIVVERIQDWLNTCINRMVQFGVENLSYVYRQCYDSYGQAEYYLEMPPGFEPDVIINDDAYRTECCQMAVDYFTKKEGGGILISDNWYQSFVWVSDKAVEILKPYEAKIFEQKNHVNNDGINKWKTAIHFIK